MWTGIFVAIGVLALSTLITMFVREEPLHEAPPPLDWRPFGRLVAMTVVFMVVILGLGEAAKGVGRLADGIASRTGLLFLMGGAGLVAMAAAVIVGVWGSIRISLGGEDARQNSAFSWWVINRLAFLIGVNNLSGFAIYFLQARLGLPGESAAGPAGDLMMVVGITILLCAPTSGWHADQAGRKWLVALSVPAMLIGLAGWIWAPAGMLRYFGGSFAGAGIWNILLSVAPSSWLSGRTGQRRLVAASGVLAALGVVAIMLATDMTLITVGGIIVGAATGTFFTTNWALGTDIVPKEKAGRYLGLSNLAGAGAGAVGSYIGGPIADYFTVRTPEIAGLGYVLLFGIFGVLFLLSALVLVMVREPTEGNTDHLAGASAGA
jgi:MFS family permease